MNIDNDKTNYNTDTKILTNLLVLDSDHRDTTIYSKANNFIIDLDKAGQPPLRDVLGIRMYKFYMYGGSSSNLQPSSVYLQLNDYNHIITGTPLIKSAFANFITNPNGVTFYDSSSVLMETDSSIYTFNPVAGNIRKFKISILNSDGTLYDTKDFKVVMSLTVLSKRNKYSRN